MKCADCGLEILDGELHFISANKFHVHARNVWGWSELCISRLKSALVERDKHIAELESCIKQTMQSIGAQ